jgi:hypothetical protein
MKKINERYTNNIFENIKYIDEYGNEYWYVRITKSFGIQGLEEFPKSNR